MGTRLKEETEYRPKPLVPIGGIPIIWHIMKLYSFYGFNDFILCLGYKGRMIKEFFMDYDWDSFDFTINLRDKTRVIHYDHEIENWTITFADTGLNTMTAGRIRKVKKYINEDKFMVTYGDGVGDINIKELVKYHNQMGKIATITGLHPVSKYGIIKVSDGIVRQFKEKPVLNDIINGGFMVFNSEIFDYIKEDCMLVEKTLPELASIGELALYKHDGFWHCMDTYKDYITLNKMYDMGFTPWMVWKHQNTHSKVVKQ